MRSAQPSVSIIIPAYNAERTIRRTLETAAAQTYRNLEILVVDDGSTDATAAIVLRFAKFDSRVVLLRQQNMGVAAARNHAINAAKGEFIAPLDADDIWHPTKIEKQLDLFKWRPSAGLIYTWYRVIDDDELVINSPAPAWARGDVYNWLIVENFIGNSSSPMIRTSLLLATGGYDPSLRAAGAQGAEDLKMQLNIAAVSDCDVVPEYLVGYRQSASSMSTSHFAMLRSKRLVLEHVRRQFPFLPDRLFRWSDGEACAFYCTEVAPSQPRAAFGLLTRATFEDPVAAYHVVGKPAFGYLLRRLKRALFFMKSRNDASIRRADKFLDVSPTQLATFEPPGWNRSRIDAARASRSPRDGNKQGLSEQKTHGIAQ